MKQLSTLIFLLFLTTVVSYGQTKRQYLKAADEAIEQQNFFAALKYYEEALQFDSAQTEIWFRYGECARMFNAFTLSEKAFLHVLAQDDSGKFPLARYNLAGVQKSLGKYSEAIGNYQLAIQDTTKVDPQILATARRELESCEWALEVTSNPNKNIRIEKLGEEVNTPFSEFGADQVDRILYYTSFSYIHEDDKNDPPRHYNKILFSEDGAFGQLMENINSTTRHTAHTAFNSNGSRLYFTYCDYYSEAGVRCELYYQQRDTLGNWGNPVRLPDNINQKGYTSSEPQVALDYTTGYEWLFYASDRPGGKGKMDIWYVTINPNGSFSDPVNLDSINTEGDDITPFFHSATNTLYFSNNSRQGLGGFDIFKSVRKENTWSMPEHMGYPLNSSYDDIHYKLSKGGADALFSSNRLGSTFIEKEKEACCHDIYRMETTNIELLALTFDNWTKQPLSGVTVTLQKISGHPKGDPESQINKVGNDFHFLPERRGIYVVTADRPGYLPYRDTLYLDRAPHLDLTSITKEIYMEPAEIQLNVLVFDDYTKTGLIGSTVQLLEVDGDQKKLVEEFTNENGNDFQFKLKPGKMYIIRGIKSGYEQDLDTIQPLGAELKSNRTLNRELYLQPLIFAEFLPLTLYFDNDEPDQRTLAVTTNKSYLPTWEKYYARKELFKREFTGGMNEQFKAASEQRLDDFFESAVNAGGQSFKIFSDLLYEFLKQGNKLEIVLRGYTSPRAATDYNYNLSQRRISSVRNHFESYKDGIFKPYLEQGLLKILEKPYGETKANPEVSDKIDDVRNSIYGVPASSERRVEILDVRQADDLDLETSKK